LLRSALEILILREILDLKNSKKYYGKTIQFVKDIPSPKALIKYAEKSGLDKVMHTDVLLIFLY
jgi:hypothetical protein